MVILVTLALRHILGWVFLTSAVAKLFNREGFREEVGRYPAVHERLVLPVSILLPIAELLLALNLLLGLYWRLAALGALALLLVFSAAIMSAVVTGRRESCQCGGLMPTRSLSYTHVVLNLAMAGGAAVLAVLAETSAGIRVPWEGILHQQQQGFDGGSFGVMVLTLGALLALSTVNAIGEMRSLRQGKDDLVFNSTAA